MGIFPILTLLYETSTDSSLSVIVCVMSTYSGAEYVRFLSLASLGSRIEEEPSFSQKVG